MLDRLYLELTPTKLKPGYVGAMLHTDAPHGPKTCLGTLVSYEISAENGFPCEAILKIKHVDGYDDEINLGVDPVDVYIEVSDNIVSLHSDRSTLQFIAWGDDLVINAQQEICQDSFILSDHDKLDKLISLLEAVRKYDA